MKYDIKKSEILEEMAVHSNHPELNKKVITQNMDVPTRGSQFVQKNRDELAQTIKNTRADRDYVNTQVNNYDNSVKNTRAATPNLGRSLAGQSKQDLIKTSAELAGNARLHSSAGTNGFSQSTVGNDNSNPNIKVKNIQHNRMYDATFNGSANTRRLQKSAAKK